MTNKWIEDNFGKEWGEVLHPLLTSNYFKKLGSAIAAVRKDRIVHPTTEDMFKAFRLTPFNKVKVVFCGQDPYFSKNYADGLLFSNSYVMFESDAAPSLKILLQELSSTHPEWEQSIAHGRLDPLDLSRWAKQGVLLINAAFSVPEGYPGTHIAPWFYFTREIFNQLNSKKDLVFVFFGKEAQQYAKFITEPSHTVLEITHPAAEVYGKNAGFLGSNTFKRVDEELALRNKSIIHW